MSADEEMSRRMTYEYERKMATQASYYDFIMDTAKDDPLGAAEMLCTGLMRGDRDTLKLGYGIGAALIATLEQISLTNQQIGVLVERIANPKPGLVDYGPTPRD
jgi:hypothetical protein